MLKRAIVFSIIIFLLLNVEAKSSINRKKIFLMGGSYVESVNEKDDMDINVYSHSEKLSYSLERFFRPSNVKILNDKVEKELYDMYGKNPNHINIPEKFISTEEESIINYFNVLREAAYPTEKTRTGCGTLGEAQGPYSVAYNFLSKEYKSKVTYKQFLNSFKNILHINLIKLNRLENKENNKVRYFVEVEAIEGSKEQKGTFSYYYGYIDLKHEQNIYTIDNIEYTAENYLCAPYHGWAYDAKMFVDIEYGDWCSLINGTTEVLEEGYEKKVYFKDKNLNEYYVLFYELTNGTDIKIQDYKKSEQGQWIPININTKKCLPKS